MMDYDWSLWKEMDSEEEARELDSKLASAEDETARTMEQWL